MTPHPNAPARFYDGGNAGPNTTPLPLALRRQTVKRRENTRPSTPPKPRRVQGWHVLVAVLVGVAGVLAVIAWRVHP